MYELLYEYAIRAGAEMSVCAYTRVDAESGKVLCREMTQFGNLVIDMKENRDKLAIINTSLWNKLLRRDIALKHIRFEHAPRVAEDMMFLLSIYPQVKRIAFCGETLYCYYVRSGSAMSHVDEEEAEHLRSSMVRTRDHVREYGKDWDNVINLFSFIHFGIAFVLKSSGAKGKSLTAMEREIKQWMNREFTGWNRNPYLRCRHVLGGHAYLLKPMLVLWMYRLRLFPIFLRMYVWVTERWKFDIKW